MGSFSVKASALAPGQPWGEQRRAAPGVAVGALLWGCSAAPPQHAVLARSRAEPRPMHAPRRRLLTHTATRASHPADGQGKEATAAVQGGGSGVGGGSGATLVLQTAGGGASAAVPLTPGTVSPAAPRRRPAAAARPGAEQQPGSFHSVTPAGGAAALTMTERNTPVSCMRVSVCKPDRRTRDPYLPALPRPLRSGRRARSCCS